MRSVAVWRAPRRPSAARSQVTLQVDLRNFGGTSLAAGDATLTVAANATAASAVSHPFGAIASGDSVSLTWERDVDSAAAGDSVEWTVEVKVDDESLVLRGFLGVSDAP